MKWPVRLVLAIIALYVVFGIAYRAIDRMNRTQEIAGIRPAGAIHATASGLIIGVDADGSVFAADAVDGSVTTVLDGLEGPLAAAMGDDGTVCAVDRSGPAGLALRCTDGRSIELTRPNVAGSNRTQPPTRADVVADGRGGWLVADPGASAVLGINREGRQTVVATFEACYPTPAAAPIGLAVDDDSVAFVALLEHGATRIGGEVSQRCGPFQYLGGDDTIAVIPRGTIPIALTRMGATGIGRLYWYPGGDGASRVLLDDIRDPLGATLLPDGRIAIATAGSLWIYRAESLPGY